MTNKTRKWVRGGVEVLIHGGTSALIAAVIAYVQKKGMTWKEFEAALTFQFLGNGALRFLQWWNNNPIPPDDTDPGIGEPQKISMNPLSKVVPAPLPPTPETK